MKKKSLEISRIRIGSSRENAALRERVGELERIVSELIKALEIDFETVDLNNFSDFGVNQIDERIKKTVLENVGEVV